MAFNRSLLQVLDYRPWRWTTAPTYDANGNVITPGVKQELNGVFILFSDELVAILKEGLTQAEKDELQQWVNVYTEAQCAMWNVPVWAGNDRAVYCRVPAAVWSDPATDTPAKVKRFFASLWREATT